MKNVASYLFSIALICIYLSASVGFEEHSCTLDGSSKMTLLFRQSPCKHSCHCGDGCGCRHDCRCITHGDCCQTSVFLMDDDQNTVDNQEIVAPTVLIVAWHHIFDNTYTLYNTAAMDIDTATIVFGPGRGLSAFAPLRC